MHSRMARAAAAPVVGAALAIRPGYATQDGRHSQRQRAVAQGLPVVVPVRAAVRQPPRPY